MSEYNGHPSWDHWNASLWFGNDEGLYNLATKAESWEELAEILDEIQYHKTPDGCRLSNELIEYAWRSVDDARAECAS